MTVAAADTQSAATLAAARAVHAVRICGEGATEVRALDDVSVAFGKGEFTAIMGPSGSGKSTLLHCFAGLDRLTSGQISIGDTDLTTLVVIVGGACSRRCGRRAARLDVLQAIASE